MSVVYPNFPQTTKTLLHQQSLNVTYEVMHHGRYAHISNWLKNLEKFVSVLGTSVNQVELTINVDGIPLFKDSRKNHAYPILMKVNPKDSLDSKIICAGVYIL
jgi:hypothetical protein